MRRSLELLLIIITITVSLNVKSSELGSGVYEACELTANSAQCVEYVNNCSDEAEGQRTANECLTQYLNDM